MLLKKNVIANFAGSGWTALMGLAFVPFYIRWMGVESYGIVGVYTSLVGMLAVLDMGLSQAMTREMARASSDVQNIHRMADTARTLEVIYWGVALVVGVFVVLLATPISNYWLNPQLLTRGGLQQAIWLMGLVIALRWPVSLYMGGLNGLQRQVQVNVLLSVVATLQGVGALLVLWFVAPTIQAFFMWQAAMALVQVIALRSVLWRSLPNRHVGRFNKMVLNDIWHFAAGMSGISLLATILTQMDKVILSKVLSLSEFGYYTFAATVASVLFRLISPVYIAYYPRLTELISRNDTHGLIRTYHQGSQLMAVAILPVTIVLVLFSKEILDVWTGNPDMALHTSLLISLLAIGNALNGLMHMPYALQLAHGWTRLALFQNLGAVAVLAPAIYFATLRWGAVGAATVWIALNCGYIFVSIHVMHRHLLHHEKWSWYFSDIIKPLGAIVLLSLTGRFVLGENAEGWIIVTVLLITLLVTTVAAIESSSALREKFLVRELWASTR